MSSASASWEPTAGLLPQVQQLYDSHRYLEAYAITSHLWQHSTNVSSLTPNELILAGRLAGRLGGWRLSRWLLRKAIERDPQNPRVRYFTRHLQAPRSRLLDELKAFNAQPDLGGDDPELRASWLASYAYTWASLRDFDRAYECLEQAHTLAPNDGWVLSCESDVYGIADRWVDALDSAEKAWAANPGAYFAANSLGISLLNLGRVEESAERLRRASEGSQSYQLVLEACWHLCAYSEVLEGKQKRSVLDQARSLAETIPSLTPLLDRDSRRSVARVNLDIAEQSDDHGAMEHWSTELQSPFHRQLLANLKQNTNGIRIRLPFHRTVQKHEACVPTSISSVMSASGMELSADKLASQVTFGGTYEWAAADWLRGQGYHVRFFPVTPELSAKLIQQKIAFVLSWDAEENGHAVAVVGFDERAGVLLIHDPQSFRTTEYLLSILDPGISPLGIKGMAIVPKERAAELDLLLPPECAVIEAAQEHQKAMSERGPSAAREILVDLARRFSSHPGTQYLQAVQALEDGKVGEALKILTALLNKFPRAPMVRVRYMSACRALGNLALLRQALRDIVEGRTLPGMDAQQDWVHPPLRYVFEYADLLGLSADTRDEAESLLHAAIRRQWNSSGAWHTLGDLYWQRRQLAESTLCFRIASCLHQSDEHYARAYADALAAEKRYDEAFDWLEKRVRTFGGTPHGVSTWVSWIIEFENRGYPERALAACHEALEQHPGSVGLLLSAVPFFARMGEWEIAERQLEHLRGANNPAAFFEASTHLSRMRGDLQKAIDSAEAWVREMPRDMEAREALLELITSRDGANAAAELAGAWMREYNNHEDFEQTYCRQLDRSSLPTWRKLSVLVRRMKRNRDDAWALRELTFEIISRHDIAGERYRKRVASTIEKYLAECDRTSAEAAVSIRAHALWAENRGLWAEAVEKSLSAIALEPEWFYSYQRAWECSSRLDHKQRQELWARMEPLLVNSSGRLTIARDVMRLLAERFGVAEAEKGIGRWRNARPGDPEVVEAAADLLIDFGHGRSDGERAISLLEPTVARFPYHAGLRFSLANAYRRAGRPADAEAVYSEIARRHPSDSSVKVQFAWIRQRQGDEQGAYSILDAALASAPRNTDLLEARVQILVENGRFDEAIQFIESALERMPENIHWRSRAISLFIDCGSDENAILAARKGVELYPGGAYLWLLLGRTLNDLRQFAEVGEIEACLRRSLSLNCGLFESADLLSISLAEQRRYADSAALIRDLEKRMPDPSPALGRLAWIRRVQGEKKEALEDLSGVVAASPWYTWGWGVLIDWLEEDQSWEKAQELLREIPAPLYTNTNFRLRRLFLLQKAGLDTKQLDTEWDSLLRDFPEDVSLHARRYDSLSAAKRRDEAAKVIKAVLHLDPDSPFLLARQTEVLARENRQAALAAALQVCFGPVEESTWPADKVWEVAKEGIFTDELFAQCREKLKAGAKPTMRSFLHMAEHAMGGETKRAQQSRISAWFPKGGVLETVQLLDLLKDTNWDSSPYRAALFAVWSDFGYERLVIRCAKKTESKYSPGLEEWSQVGRAFVGMHRYRAGRAFLRDWRNVRGVGMWVVANYAICLSTFWPGQLRERIASCRDALNGLPHDHCARYLAHLQAEACALRGDRPGFLECWNLYRKYFDGKLEAGEYFRSEDRHLLFDIPKLASHYHAHRFWKGNSLILGLWLRRIFQTKAVSTTENARPQKADVDVPWWVIWFATLLLLRLFSAWNQQ